MFWLSRVWAFASPNSGCGSPRAADSPNTKIRTVLVGLERVMEMDRPPCHFRPEEAPAELVVLREDLLPGLLRGQQKVDGITKPDGEQPLQHPEEKIEQHKGENPKEPQFLREMRFRFTERDRGSCADCELADE